MKKWDVLVRYFSYKIHKLIIVFGHLSDVGNTLFCIVCIVDLRLYTVFGKGHSLV